MIKTSTDVFAISQEAIDKRKTENFPVASFLMPKKSREGVIDFYNFARHADEISDENLDNPKNCLKALKAIDEAISSDQNSSQQAQIQPPKWAMGYMQQVNSGALDNRHGRALLSAFMQDVEQSRYDDWDSLIDYCMRSAAPVGRAVLELNQEWNADITASDNICNVLQILNHLQDLKSDFLERDRIYFPVNWFGNVNQLAEDAETKNIRQLINRSLDNVDEMLADSQHLPQTLKSFRLRIEITTIYYIAVKLSEKLRRIDPIKNRVKLSKFEYISCFIKAGFATVTNLFKPSTRSENNQQITHKSKTSFLRPLLGLNKQKQQAMFNLYAFCRYVDDAVDDAETPDQAEENIEFWQSEIDALYSTKIADYPTNSITRSLLPDVKRFSLKKQYFDDIIAGMRMDITTENDHIFKPTLAEFGKYCYRVASCVGHLSVNIFGENNKIAHQFADELGRALQIINIMRDVYVDAKIGRIYLPKELLKKYNSYDITCENILNLKYQIEISNILRELGTTAQKHFDNSTSLVNDDNRSNLEPALMMGRIYQLYFNKIKESGYKIGKVRIKLSKLEKLSAIKNR